MISPIKISPFNNRMTSVGGIAPVNTVAPAISGVNEPYSTLTCSTGTWINGVVSYDYQWKRGATNIGTNSANYTQVVDDLNQNITCTVTATNAIGNSSQVSNTVVCIFNRLSFGVENAWDSENTIPSGTTTTATDYAGVHSLSNPSATNQPTKNAAALNGYDTYTFVTDDYLKKVTSNYQSTNTQGMLTMVVKKNGNGFICGLTVGNSTITNNYLYTFVAANKFSLQMGSTLPENNKVTNDTTVNDNDWYVIQIVSTGSAYKWFQDGVLVATSVVGMDNGKLFNGPLVTDSIGIGATLRSAPIYGNIEWAYSSYGTYVDDATTIKLGLILKKKYNIL